MAPSSPFDIAESSADYWKRQLTLEETVNLLYWISLLNSRSYCFCAFAIALILLGKGWVYRSEWYWDRHSFLVEHPQQHILKLRKRINRYFLLVQFNTALQISVAETQEYLSISNPTQSLDSKSFGESLQQLEQHHRVGFILPPLSLDIGLKQWSYEFCFWIFCLSISEALIFLSCWTIVHPSKLAQVACFPPKQPWTFLQNYEKIRHIAEQEQLKFYVVVELFLFFAQFSFLFVHFHSS